MINEDLLKTLTPYIDDAYCIVIIVIGLLIKAMSERHEGGCPRKKWVLKIDTDKRYPFNIRVVLLVISFIIGVGIYVADANITVRDLFVSFCIAGFAYEYLVKYIKNKLKTAD